jgi:hypothetical protein
MAEIAVYFQEKSSKKAHLEVESVTSPLFVFEFWLGAVLVPDKLFPNTNDTPDFQRLPISQRKWCDDISMGLWKRLLVFSAPKLGCKVDYRNLQKCMRDLCFHKWPHEQLNRGKRGKTIISTMDA